MASWSWTKKLTLLAVLAVSVTVLSALAGMLTGLATVGTAPPLQGVFADNFTLTDPPAPAPTAEFQTLDGEAAALADYRGGVVLVNFWATWCAPCIREMPSLDRLQAALGPEGLTFVPWWQSPNWLPLLIVGNEVSGTTTVFQIGFQQ